MPVIQLPWLRLFPACVLSRGVQAAAPRSTTVILVKNLPAGVTTSELEELFSPHGSLGRVLLPPSGLTAIIEFLEPTEAKRAFTRLAYSKVSVALYRQNLHIQHVFEERHFEDFCLSLNTLVPARPAVFGVGTCGGVCGSQTRTR